MLVASILIFFLVLHSGFQEDSTMELVERVMKSCKEQHKIQNSEIEDAIKSLKFPSSVKGKRFLLCIIKGVGFNQLKSLIRSMKRPNGESIASIIEVPDLEKELDELASQVAIT